MTQRFSQCLALSLALSIPAWASAQETYSLKLPSPAVHDVNHVECDMSQNFGLTKFDAFGQQFKDESSDGSSHMVYSDTILEVKEDQVTSFRRHFDAAVQCVRQDPPAVMSCQGKTVLVEMKGGKAVLNWEDGAPPPDAFVHQVEELLKGSKAQLGDFARVDPLPRFPVKVGDAWPVDVEALVRNCQEKQGCEIKGVKAEAKLEKVEKRGGSSFALVKVRVEVPLKRIEQGERVIKLEEGSGMTWEATFDFCCDGTSSTFETHNRFHFLTVGLTPESSGLSTRLRLDTEVKLSEQRSQLK